MDNEAHILSHSTQLVVAAVALSVGAFFCGYWWGSSAVTSMPDETNRGERAITKAPIAPPMSDSAQPTAKQTEVLISQLKQRVDELTSQLQQSQMQQRHLTEQHQQLNERLLASELGEQQASTRTKLGASSPQTLEPVELLDSETLKTVLPVPFDRFYHASNPNLVQRFNQFIQQPRDEHWALLMENNIQDFIAMHELSGEIELVGVECKTSGCQVRGFERQDSVWSRIYEQMKRQPWWKFRRSSASSESTNELRLFYLLAIN